MTQRKESLKVCKNGHKFYKSSDCPVCPHCEKLNKPSTGFLSDIPAPARRALDNNGITTLEKLSKLTVKEVLSFHGMGPSTIPKLEAALKSGGKSFKKKKQ